MLVARFLACMVDDSYSYLARKVCERYTPQSFLLLLVLLDILYHVYDRHPFLSIAMYCERHVEIMFASGL